MLALPIMLPFVAFTKEVPATDEVKVTDAFPSEPVIADDGLTVPTVGLLLVNDMVTPAIGVVPFRAVAVKV